MATLTQILAGRNLSRMVQGIQSGLPLQVPESFLTPTDPRISGNVAEWFEVDGNRDIALVVSQGSPARRQGHQNAKFRSANMLHSFESQQFQGQSLLNLTRMLDPVPNGAVQQKGEDEIIRQTTWFKRRMSNLYQTAVQMMLLTFKLYFNEKGQLLPSSSGAVVTVDPAIPAGQTGQLDILGSGAIIGATWATAGTDIIDDLATIREQMAQLGGWLVTEAFYGKNIPKYVAANTTCKEFLYRNAEKNDQIMTGNVMPSNFQGYNWHNASNAFYIDAGGTVRKMLGDDEIVFCPAPSPDWWRVFHGTTMVPTGVPTFGMEGVDMLKNLEEVFGMFSYASMSHNPVSIEQFCGHNFLPVIAATKAVCRCDVTP